MPLPVGFANPEREIDPRFVGLHLHVAVIFGELPEVRILMHPGMRFPFAVKVTFEGRSTLAIRLIALLYVALSTFPVSENELKLTGTP